MHGQSPRINQAYQIPQFTAKLTWSLRCLTTQHIQLAMTSSSCNLRISGRTLVFCLCGAHLMFLLLYTLHSKESLTFSISPRGILAKAVKLLSSQTTGNTTESLGENATEPSPVLYMCPENPPRLGKSFLVKIFFHLFFFFF